MSCAVSESQDGPDFVVKRLAGLNRVHDNEGIMLGVALCIAFVIAFTCIMRYRLTNSVRMTHEEPTHPRQHAADLQLLSSSQRKRLKNKAARKSSRNKQQEEASWTETHAKTELDGNCGITRCRHGSPESDTMQIVLESHGAPFDGVTRKKAIDQRHSKSTAGKDSLQKSPDAADAKIISEANALIQLEQKHKDACDYDRIIALGDKALRIAAILVTRPRARAQKMPCDVCNEPDGPGSRESWNLYDCLDCLGWAYECRSMWVECMVLQKEIRLRWQKSEDAKGQIQVSGRL